MARIRTIKPEFFDDEDVAAMSMAARLGFIGLWQQADREGRLRDRPVRLKARIFPFDDLNMETLLDELERHRFIRRYVVGGERFIHVRTLTKHQQMNPREAPSHLPAPPPDSEKHVLEHAKHGNLVGGKEGKGMEGNGKEGKEDSSAPHSDAKPPLLTFPTVGMGPKSWDLTSAYVAELAEAYPGTDVLGECRKALQWVKAHQAKTARGMPAFLVGWLNRAVDWRGSRSRPVQAGATREARADIPHASHAAVEEALAVARKRQGNAG